MDFRLFSHRDNTKIDAVPRLRLLPILLDVPDALHYPRRGEAFDVSQSI